MTQSGTPHKRRNFSLGKLIVAVLLLSAAGSLLYMRGEIDRLQQDNRELAEIAQQVGKIYITDKTKIHVFALTTMHPLEPFGNWHWRIYIPPGRKYLICSKIGLIGPDEVPIEKEGMPAVSGEFSLDAHLQQNNGKWDLELASGPYSELHEFSDPLPNFLKTGGDEDNYYAGVTRVVTLPFGNPMVLLRMREYFIDPIGTTQVYKRNPQPCPGFMIWLQEDPATKK